MDGHAASTHAGSFEAQGDAHHCHDDADEGKGDPAVIFGLEPRDIVAILLQAVDARVQISQRQLI